MNWATLGRSYQRGSDLRFRSPEAELSGLTLSPKPKAILENRHLERHKNIYTSTFNVKNIRYGLPLFLFAKDVRALRYKQARRL
jgi:hypothetical protein